MLITNIDDTQFILRVVIFFMSAGVLLSSLEWLALLSEFGRTGIYHWPITRLLHAPTIVRAGGNVLNVICSQQSVAIALVARIGTAAWCLMWCVFQRESVPLLGLCGLSATGLYINSRTYYGLEGSDQLLTLLCVSLTLGALAQNEGGIDLALYFIAAQSTLSYFAAGVTKLWGKEWRKGNAVSLIVSTRAFGHPYFSRLLDNRPVLGRIATFTVLAFECSLPLALILPLPFTLAYLLVGFLFHLANSVVLGLNVFLWAYLATYPAILFTALRISGHH
jgi:hypothetical protein